MHELVFDHTLRWPSDLRASTSNPGSEDRSSSRRRFWRSQVTGGTAGILAICIPVSAMSRRTLRYDTSIFLSRGCSVGGIATQSARRLPPCGSGDPRCPLPVAAAMALALFLVTPETLLRRDRELSRREWRRWRSTRGRGRPPMSDDLVELIVWLARVWTRSIRAGQRDVRYSAASIRAGTLCLGPRHPGCWRGGSLATALLPNWGPLARLGTTGWTEGPT
jgi:hypothetical protein